MIKTRRAFGVFLVTVALVVGPAALVSLAKGRGSHVASASTVEMLMVDTTDAVANYGDVITFAVDTNETSYPFVALVCWQGEDMVYANTAGIFPDYTWSQDFTLSSAYWSGDAADCTARMYYFTTNGRERTLATLDFVVSA